MRRLRVAILPLLVLLVAVACVSAGPLPGPGSVTPLDTSSVSPLAPSPTTDTFNSAPPVAAPTAEPTPTQDPAKATVIGSLFVDPGAPKPVTRTILYLGGLVSNASGTPAAASMDRITSPRTGTEATGAFRFDNVTPGRYVLILDRFSGSYMLNDPKSGGDMVFDVRPGQVLDLGKLVYDSLPDTGQKP